jgi:hypothetical protein
METRQIDPWLSGPRIFWLFVSLVCFRKAMLEGDTLSLVISIVGLFLVIAMRSLKKWFLNWICDED